MLAYGAYYFHIYTEFISVLKIKTGLKTTLMVLVLSQSRTLRTRDFKTSTL